MIFLKGLLIGLTIAAPVGPIGVLCIQRSLHEGFRVGLMTGLGAAVADGVYGIIAAFGLTAISSFLIIHQFWIRTLGGIFLLFLGIKLLLKKPVQLRKIMEKERSSLHALSTTFLLTLTNPATILSFLGIFSGLGIGTTTNKYHESLLFVLGILIGSAAWWLFLSGLVVKILRHRIDLQFLRLINQLSGLIIIGFGLFVLFSIFVQ